MMTKVIIAWCLLILGHFAFTITTFAQEIGRPFIQTFPPSKYKADGQNWQVIQDKRGIIYVRNNDVILEYDGVSFRHIEVLGGRQITYVAMGDNDIIYLSVENDFGYLMPDEKGSWQFHSVKELLEKTEKEKAAQVTRVYFTQEGTYYVSAKKMYRYKMGSKEVKYWTPKDRFRGGFIINGKLVTRDKEGWVELVNDEWKPVSYNSEVSQIPVPIVIPFDGANKYLIGSSEAGFFILNLTPRNNNYVTKFPTDVDKFIAEHSLTHGILLADGNIALATTTGGIAVIDGKGNLKQIVNKKSGLMDNNIYYLYSDNQNGVWAAGLGLNRVELGSPISNWYDEVGGWVTAIGEHKGTIYVGAQGAYYLSKEGFKDVEDFSKTKRSWVFYNYQIPNTSDSILLMGGDDGMYEVTKIKAKLVKEMPTAFSFLTSKFDKNRVFVAHNSRVDIIRYEMGKWVEEGKVENFTGSVRTMAEDKKGNLWLGTYRNGVKYVDFSSEFKAPVVYDRNNGLPDINHVNIYQFDDEILFTNSHGLFEYDESAEKFVPAKKYKKNFEENKLESFILEKTIDGEIWVGPFKTNNQPIGKLIPQSDGSYQWYDKPYRRLPAIEMEVIYKDQQGITWIGGSEGLYRFDNKMKREYEQPYQAYVRRVTIGEDSVFFNGAYSVPQVTEAGDTIRVLDVNQKTIPVLDYKFNSLTFNFAAPSFDNSEDANEYQYFLEGYQTHWTNWSKETRQSFTNLPAGKYTFRVKAKNAYGAESKEGSFSFKITPPWYQTMWAYASYAVLGSLMVLGLVKYNTRRLKAQNKQLEALVKKRTAEIEKQKDQIEKAYQDIKTLSEIGQKITATLEFDKLIEQVYKSVNALTAAEAFGVGIYNKEDNRLEFKGFIEKGYVLPVEYDSLNDDRRLSVWCFKNQKPVFINNLEKEYKEYTGFDFKPRNEDYPKSTIYLPLALENEKIGVITVQSFRPNAYNDIDLTILQSLASYVSIAFSNNRSYAVIQDKNLQITDSIRYAETIQTAVLPSSQIMDEGLQDYFVIYKPKDIVSGDFYWYNLSEDRIFLAVADCTGHGVPGALMSMIGTATLNEIVNLERIYSPAKILERMHERIRRDLKQEEAKNDDGMDIGLCMIEVKAESSFSKIIFAGAKQSLYFIKNKEFMTIKGDRKSIGGMQREEVRTFTDNELVLGNGDCMYLCTDGYIDQQDANKQKIGSNKLKELLSLGATMELKQQRKILEDTLEMYLQGTQQRDDITILGVRF
ncbi:MAG: hypothetical protein OHK0038_22690 [Flammeovirgaceae bacterium]